MVVSFCGSLRIWGIPKGSLRLKMGRSPELMAYMVWLLSLSTQNAGSLPEYLTTFFEYVFITLILYAEHVAL